ncbi:MAG TPA: divalent-cation tolerance protein CutA [Sandaracinaceae bacterium]
MQDGPILVLCTAPDAEVGAKLARGLVEARLAACVNVVPGLRSFYVWKGEVHDEPEVQLLVKTRRSRFDALSAWIAEHHPYEVPEIVALPIEAGAKSYLDWLEEQTR